MEERLQKLIESSRRAHVIMPYDETETTDYRLEKKPVLESVLLDGCDSLAHWEAVSPYARVSLSGRESLDGACSVLFQAPTNLKEWLPGRAKGRIYYEPKAMRKLDHADLTAYNRLSVWIKPDVPGMRSIAARLQLHNEGPHPVPDRFEREGHHNVNLKNGEWNHVTCEIEQLDRNDVVGIAIEYDMCGHEFDAADEIKWYIDRLELQKVQCDMYAGWTPGPGRIAFSGSGYRPDAEKLAVMRSDSAGDTFRVIETETGRVVLEKRTEKANDCNLLDFSEVRKEGRYLLLCGDTVSRAFDIGGPVWQPSAWKVLNFYLSQRCGFEVPGKHHACHSDLLLTHNGKSIVANGGCVRRKSYPRNFSGIAGYGRPLYDETVEAKKPEQTFNEKIPKGWCYRFRPMNVSAGAESTSVLLLKEILKARGLYNGQLSWKCDDQLIAAINGYQTRRRKAGIELGSNGQNDSTCGPKMWADLLALPQDEDGYFYVYPVAKGTKSASALLLEEIFAGRGMYNGGLDWVCGTKLTASINIYQNLRRKDGVELGSNGQNDSEAGSKVFKDLIDIA